MRRILITLLLALGLGGCSAGTQATTQASSTSPPAAAHTATTHRARHHQRARHQSRPHPKPTSKPGPVAGGGLPVSGASAGQVQTQPAPGSCHAAGHGELVMPDLHCTPGALNPAVTQATINQTICMSGYTKTIRPSTSVTEPEKLASMAAYGYSGRSPGDFEYDHLVSLELGGAANDPRNLWPETGGSPNPKDSIENRLHGLVCDGQMRLAQAQHIIATDWIGWARRNGTGTSSPPSTPATSTRTSPAPPSTPGGPNKPISEVNCSDFPTHAAAQQWFTAHGGSASNDVAGLDRNHDGIACSSLP